MSGEELCLWLRQKWVRGCLGGLSQGSWKRLEESVGARGKNLGVGQDLCWLLEHYTFVMSLGTETWILVQTPSKRKIFEKAADPQIVSFWEAVGVEIWQFL